MITHDTERQIFFYHINHMEVGKLAYRFLDKNRVDAYSTVVNPQFQGQGIARDLYDAFMQFVIDEELKVKPSCSYIDVQMQRNHPNHLA